MDIYNILKESLRGEGSDKMWRITKMLSDSIEEYVPEKQRESLMGDIYYSINGGHFNKDFADKIMPRMYYLDETKIKHNAPYWTESEVKPLYEAVKSKIPAYNFYDFEVTLNMIKSDEYPLLKRWFPNASDAELLNKMIEESVNYLDDEDNPYGNEKIWKYLNA